MPTPAQAGAKFVKRAKDEIVAKSKLFGVSGSLEQRLLKARCQGSGGEEYGVEIELEATSGPRLDWCVGRGGS